MALMHVVYDRWVWIITLTVAIGSLRAVQEQGFIVSLAQHPAIPIWVEQYRAQERKVWLRQQATWAVAAIAGLYVAYKTFGPVEAKVSAVQIDKTLELLKQPGFVKSIEQSHQLYLDSQNSAWYQWLAWTSRGIKGLAASFVTNFAYQVVVSPWVSLFNGPVYKKIYGYALGEVTVNNTVHWWVQEQTVGSDNQSVALHTVRLPLIAWWLMQELRILDEAYKLEDRESFTRAAVKIYAQFTLVHDEFLDNDFERQLLTMAQGQFARVIDDIALQGWSLERYEDCKKVLRRVRLLESYRIIGSLF